MLEQKQQQESISAGEGSNLRETGLVLNYPGKCLYNHESCSDNAVLDCSQLPEDLQPILHEEVEIAASLKKGSLPELIIYQQNLIKLAGQTMIDVLTEICNKIWRTGEWPTRWTQSLIITLPNQGNLQLCQNYRTISIISHSSKVMLRVILNRLNPIALRRAKTP